MFTVATRARTLLALGLLTVASAAWTLPLWDRINARGDDTDLAASSTLTVIAVLILANLRREKRDREARVRNLALLMPLVAGQVTPRDGDGQGQPRSRPRWYRYLNEPAA